MTFRIDRVRRVKASVRSAPQAASDSDADVSGRALALAVQPASQPQPPPRDPTAAFDAQLIGQDGQKRGLRAGQPLLDQARSSYCRTEWSGSQDRRRREGRQARLST
jgi:hypothetical protein